MLSASQGARLTKSSINSRYYYRSGKKSPWSYDESVWVSTETEKLLLPLFLKQILEISMLFSIGKEQMGVVWSNSFES